MAFNLDKTLFYLRRRLRDLEPAFPSHAEMADKKMPYEQREKLLKSLNEQQQRMLDEHDTLTDLIEYLTDPARQ